MKKRLCLPLGKLLVKFLRSDSRHCLTIGQYDHFYHIIYEEPGEIELNGPSI